MADPTFYLFDGHNLLHASGLSTREALVYVLAGFAGLRCARGVVVFDGVGAEERRGPLTVRFATPADSLLERLAADHRVAERVCLVSSDLAVRQTAGQEVRKRASKEFVAELLSEAERQRPQRETPSRIEDALDEPTRERLERWRRRS